MSTIVLDTPEKIEAARWLAVRSALSLEVRCPGMKMSRRYSPMMLAKAICGSQKQTKKGVYADLNTFMVARGFEDRSL